MPRSLAAALTFVVAVLAALAVIRWNVWSYGSDTGTFAQIALHAFAGFTDGPERGTHFHFHWSPILALLWPVVVLTRTPLSIQFVQIVLVAIAAVPLAAIVRTYAGPQWAVRAGILALMYPPMLSAAFDEFHELALYPAAALSLMWAADRARWGWFALCALALVLIREDVCLDVALIGVALGAIGLLKRKSAQRGLLAGEPIEPERLTVAGFGLAACASAALAVYALVIVPRTGGWAPSHFYHYPFADGPLQTASAIFTHPAALVQSTFTLGRLTYVLEAFAPIALLPFRTRWVWLAAPGLAGVLLASDRSVWRMGYHYSLLWAPWLLLAAAWALIRIVQTRGETAARRWWLGTIAVCAIVLIAFNPMHPAHYLSRPAFDHPRDVMRAFACVPKSAPVATHDEWFAHVALRYPNATNIGDGIEHFNGYIVYTPQWRDAYVGGRLIPKIRAAQASGRYAPVCTAGGVVVLKSTIRTAKSRAR